MLFDSTLGIPLTILSATDGKTYSQAVWMVAKHKNGYSLKLFPLGCWEKVCPKISL